MSDLKYCPMCGDASDKLRVVEDSVASGGYDFTVLCGECGLSCDYFRTREEAIAAWNRRAPETAGHGVAEHGIEQSSKTTFVPCDCGCGRSCCAHCGVDVGFVQSATPDSTAAPVMYATHDGKHGEYPPPEKLSDHGIRALERCEAELQKFIELADDYDLDEMSVQALETAMESMRLRRLSHRAWDVLHPREPMPDGWCTLAVGNGTGRLFVHGPYEAIKICQAALLAPSAPVAGSGE